MNTHRRNFETKSSELRHGHKKITTVAHYFRKSLKLLLLPAHICESVNASFHYAQLQFHDQTAVGGGLKSWFEIRPRLAQLAFLKDSTVDCKLGFKPSVIVV